MSEEKRCRVCKRIIVGKSTFGVCQDCTNKHGGRMLTVLGLLGTGSVAVFKFIRKK